MSQPTSDRQRQVFVFFLLAMLPAGNAVNPCLDVDTWWHLRVGKFIVEEKRLPDTDPFSQIGQSENVSWKAYSWLYEVPLYWAYQAGGFSGIMVIRHFLGMLTFCSIAWLLLRHAKNGWIGLATLAFVTVSLLPFTPERPWHVTIFLTTLTLHAVLRIRDGASARRFVLLPFLYIIWANVHIQFVMGFALLGLGWAVTLFEGIRYRDPQQKARAWGLFWLGAACALATLITPFHYRLYVVIWEYATQTSALRLVSELQPPVLTRWWNIPLLVLLPVAALCVARGGYRLWDLVLLASAAFFSLRMQRDLWYGVLICGTIIVRSVDLPVREVVRWPVWKVIAVSLVSLVVMLGAWAFVQTFGLVKADSFARSHAESYPVEAVEYIRTNRPPGPLFNNFDWGGYLIWELPEYPVVIDGRTNFYGEERLNRSIDTWAGIDWEKDAGLQKAGVIIAPKKRKDKEHPLTEKLREESLRENPRWKIAHEDETAIVFVPVKAPVP